MGATRKRATGAGQGTVQRRFEAQWGNTAGLPVAQFVAATISFNLADNISLSQATRAIDAAMAKIGVPNSVRGSLPWTSEVSGKCGSPGFERACGPRSIGRSCVMDCGRSALLTLRQASIALSLRCDSDMSPSKQLRFTWKPRSL